MEGENKEELVGPIKIKIEKDDESRISLDLLAEVASKQIQKEVPCIILEDDPEEVNGMLKRESVSAPQVNRSSMNPLSKDDEAALNIATPERFVENQKVSIEGFQDDSKNRVIQKICFMQSLTANTTKRWFENKDFIGNKLKIVGGNILFKIAHIGGPGVLVDLYEMYDENPEIEAEVLEKSTVGRRWNPCNSILASKFRMIRRLTKFDLRVGESIQIDSAHQAKDLDAEFLKKRNNIPCFLATFQDVSKDTLIILTLLNEIILGPSEATESCEEWEDAQWLDDHVALECMRTKLHERMSPC